MVVIGGSSLSNFEFTSSPGNISGTLFVDILVPDNTVGGNSLNFSITDGKTSIDASLFKPAAWTGGQLDSYLNISASPTNPIGAYESLAGHALSVDGFYVYQADLGANTLAGNSDPNGSPQLSLNGLLPEDSYVLAFLETTSGKGKNESTSYIATANSGTIFEDTPAPTPLPATLPLLATGLGAMVLLGWRRKRNIRAAVAT